MKSDVKIGKFNGKVDKSNEKIGKSSRNVEKFNGKVRKSKNHIYFKNVTIMFLSLFSSYSCCYFVNLFFFSVLLLSMLTFNLLVRINEIAESAEIKNENHKL